jgi:ABC-type branched-subunit amino acid transport system substrate-binding protein
VGTWYVEAREDEFKMIQREEKKTDHKKKSIRQEKSADDVLPAVVDFDAIFIPDSSKIMTQMSAFLTYAGVRNVKLLGTNLWNSPGAAKKAGLFADQLVFVDSAPAEMDESRQSKFVKDYLQLFGEMPSLIEIQAYDSALILRSLILNGASSREELTRRLTDLKKFPGALGSLEMSPQREIRRPLMTFTTTNGGNPVPLRRAY